MEEFFGEEGRVGEGVGEEGAGGRGEGEQFREEVWELEAVVEVG